MDLGGREVKRIYYAIAHQDEGSALGLTFPDVPGCFAAADDEADMTSAAREALDLFFEDADPDAFPARSMQELRRDPAVGEMLADGGVMVAVTWLPTGRTVRANISLDSELLAEIDRTAKAQALTRSGWLATAAREKLAS